jgi:hypothetical protein
MTEPEAEIADFLLRPVTDESKLAFAARCNLHELLMFAMAKARETRHGLRLKVTMPKERVSIVVSHTVVVPCRLERELDGLRIVAQRWRDRLGAVPKMGAVQRLTLEACVEQLEAALERIEEGEVAPDEAAAAPEVDEECPF